MKVVIFIFVFCLLLNVAACIGGGSWSEGKRSLISSNDNLSRQITIDFGRLKSVEERLQYLRKLCKLILKVYGKKEDPGFSIRKVCRQNIPR